MPHVIVKLWPGKTEEQKQELADSIAKEVMRILDYPPRSVSVSMEEITADDWKEKVYTPDITDKKEQLYIEPGYTM